MKKQKKDIVIVQKGEPMLRQIAEKVPVSEIKSEKIQKILKDMKNFRKNLMRMHLKSIKKLLVRNILKVC